MLVVVGFIYFKLFVRISSNISEESNVPVAQVDEMKLESIQSKKTFHLKANYADPFLKSGRIATKPTGMAGNENVAPPEPPKKKEKPPVYWPAIKYYGIVQKTTSKKPRALISIDGTMYKIHPNEEIFDGIVIKSISRESMVVSFQKETRTISLNP